MSAHKPPEQMRGLYWAAWWFVHGCFRLYFRLEARGLENVPLRGPVIFASNHVSFLDPPVIGCLIPRVVNFLARDSLFRVPLLGALIRHFQAVPVDRESGAAGLRAILDRLYAGGAIIVFPEGTRSLDGRLRSAKPGLGMTVLKSDAPVVAVRVIGAHEALGRHGWFPRPRKIVVCFGAADAFATARAEAATCARPRLKEMYQQVTDEIMTRIGELHV